jgi:hypothetical protein
MQCLKNNSLLKCQGQEKHKKNLENYSRLKDITNKYIAHKEKILNDMAIGLTQGIREPDA